MCASRLDADRKRTAPAFLTLHTHRPTVRPNQLLHEGQTNPRALVRARPRSLYSVKTLKQSRQLGFGDADARVGDREFHAVATPGERGTNPTIKGVLEGVREEVEDDLLPHIFVDEDALGQWWTVQSQRQVGLFDRRAEAAHQFRGIGVQIGRFIARLDTAGLDAGK